LKKIQCWLNGLILWLLFISVPVFAFNATTDRVTSNSPQNINCLSPQNQAADSILKTSQGFSYWHRTEGYSATFDQKVSIGHDYDFYNEEWRGFVEWDLSNILLGANITFFGLKLDISGKPGECDNLGGQLKAFPMGLRPSLEPSAESLFIDAGDGIAYSISPSNEIGQMGEFPIEGFLNMGAQACEDLNSSTAKGWFGMGFIAQDSGSEEQSDDKGLIFTISAIRIEYSLGLNTGLSLETTFLSGTDIQQTTTSANGVNPDVESTTLFVIIAIGLVFLIGIGFVVNFSRQNQMTQNSLKLNNSDRDEKPKNRIALRHGVKHAKQDHLLLKKFRSILEITHRVSTSDIATSLGLSKEDLFEYLLLWKKTIPFKIDGDDILVENVQEFMGALDQEFSAWDEKVENKQGKE